MSPLLPPALSEHASATDGLFRALVGVTAVGMALAWGSIAFVVVRRRRARGTKSVPGRESVVPNLVFLALFGAVCAFFFHRGFALFLDRRVEAPTDAFVVKVTASLFEWRLETEDGLLYGSGPLLLPSDRPIRFEVTSTDVVHTFVIPDLRVRAMAVPGRVDVFVVTPAVWTGERREVDFHCGEYCGTGRAGTPSSAGHAGMRGVLRFVPPWEYESTPHGCFLDDCAERPEGPEREACRGKRLYENAGCRACHSTRPGEDRPAPSFAGLWDSIQALDDGTEIRVDAPYVRTSIREPDRHRVRGYGNLQMPPYRFTDADVARLIAYMRTLPAANR